MQINRMFETVYILLDKKTVTAAELAEHFEVSQRTVYRDIEILSQSGIPICMTKGRGGGISIMPGFVLNKAVLTQQEKSSILASVKALDSTGADTALAKLAGMLGETNTDWVEIDFSSWGDSSSQSELFESIKKSILERKTLEINYCGANGESVRSVEPLKLCFKGSAWYLYGYCRLRQDYRFFKLKRIKKMSVTEGAVSHNPPVKVFDRQGVAPISTLKLKLHLSDNVSYRVYDEFENFDRLEDGSFKVECEFPDNGWLYYYLLTFGDDCEVISPQIVREKMKLIFEKSLKKYI